jgi:hypothetical protein
VAFVRIGHELLELLGSAEVAPLVALSGCVDAVADVHGAASVVDVTLDNVDGIAAEEG